jgi:hypothetical protein
MGGGAFAWYCEYLRPKTKSAATHSPVKPPGGVDNGWLRTHNPSRQEIAGLLAIVDRDLPDAEGNISAGWRFSYSVCRSI